MKTMMFLSVFFISGIVHNTPTEVCVLIDEQKTSDPDHPNQASEVANHVNSFFVYHGQKACFDLDKQYYMQHFLWETPNTIWYGTVCRYVPEADHEGKVLQFIGESGSYDCPVIKR